MKEYKRRMGELILVINRLTHHGIVSGEDATAMIDYMQKLDDLTLPDKYCEAIDGITELYPRPKDFDVDTGRLWDAGYQIGYICAMADSELWWNLRQAKFRKAALDKKQETFGPMHKRRAARYDELEVEIGDRNARKQIAKEEGITLVQVNRVLKKMGRF